ncbi:two-component system response regulator AgrA [Lactobacillus colini]|uniref:Two-component system response regulator AgrA n=1 Tax=Lactobacillus colini TaxID=1819254 RepID=A0ABS4MGI3_9LACO|nr:LytTR family DNA-binding domain-containing protein [Lactobacillus colini]MBP2058808.1 two-component system response regulator AgrA [Lactobacillus colini]
MNYRLIVCDDEPAIARNIADQITVAWENIQDENEQFKNKSLELSLVATSFEEVAGYIVAHDVKNAIYFLDIEISKDKSSKTGVDLADFIKSRDENSQIVFVTAYDKYAPLTYERRIGAIDYINKNQHSECLIKRMTQTLLDCVENINENIDDTVQYFSFKWGRQYQKIKVSEIYYLESNNLNHKLNLIFASGESEIKGAIKTIDKENDFLMKVSQSCLINPNNVQRIDLDEKKIFFPDGSSVYYSRSNTNKIIERFGR